MKRALSTFAAFASLAGAAYSADITISDPISEDAIWTNDNVYTLSGFIFVQDGASLTIEPGTVIKAETGTGASASALVVARGSKIYAMGTPSDPIIFTSVNDPMDGSLPEDFGGQWGGLILLGNAPINSNKSNVGGADAVLVDDIEGVPTAFGDLTEFGGDDPEDSSGIVRYVQIRFGGSPLVANSEINGLTMGGVGSGTLIEFVETFANADDGYEWFGGTVNARYLVAAFQGDDGFDYDQGWVGKGQFWFTINNRADTFALNESFTPDNAAEHDGEENAQGKYIGGATISNVTFIGGGAGADGSGIRVRDNGFAKYYNSIIGGFTAGEGVRIEESSEALIPVDPLNPGATEFDISNNIFFDVSKLANEEASEYLFDTAALSNLNVDPMLGNISRSVAGDGTLDPTPLAGSPAFSAATAELPDPWFMDVDYLGAFGDSNWLYGWTYLDQGGYLPPSNGRDNETFTAISSVIVAGENGLARSGFQIGGELPRLCVIRAKGPKLVDDGIAEADVMPNPQLRIVNRLTGEDVAVVTGWTDRAGPIEVMSNYVGLATLAADGDARPTNDEQSAVALVSLEPGVYSAVVSDEGGAGGTVQVEVYIADL